jgi:hypothetical protein
MGEWALVEILAVLARKPMHPQGMQEWSQPMAAPHQVCLVQRPGLVAGFLVAV